MDTPPEVKLGHLDNRLASLRQLKCFDFDLPIPAHLTVPQLMDFLSSQITPTSCRAGTKRRT